MKVGCRVDDGGKKTKKIVSTLDSQMYAGTLTACRGRFSGGVLNRKLPPIFA